MPPAGIRAVNTRVAVAWADDASEPSLSRDARAAARATIEHDRVIGSALAQSITPMPASLADPYDDDAAMVADIDAHAREVELAFPAIADMVEMTTIIAVHDTPPAAGVSGRGKAYLEQLKNAPNRAAEISDRIAHSLSQVFSDSRRRGNAATVALSHLMPRHAVGLYRDLVLAHAGAGYRIVIDGPRAPYSFALYSPRRGLMTDMWLGGTILAT